MGQLGGPCAGCLLTHHSFVILAKSGSRGGGGWELTALQQGNIEALGVLGLAVPGPTVLHSLGSCSPRHVARWPETSQSHRASTTSCLCPPWPLEARATRGEPAVVWGEPAPQGTRLGAAAGLPSLARQAAPWDSGAQGGGPWAPLRGSPCWWLSGVWLGRLEAPCWGSKRSSQTPR